MTTLMDGKPARVLRLRAPVEPEQLSDDLQRERELLAAADLAEMKRAFLTSVSHALRTPLSSILGFAATLARTEVELSPREQDEMLEALERNARRLEAKLCDVLDLDRLARQVTEVQRRPTDLADLMLRSVRQVEVGSRKVEVDIEPVVASVDGAKVERILEHLLLNADQHSPPSGRVWARLRRIPEGALIIVDDEGPGVPDELRGAIFEPLRHGTEMAAAPGLGIGLALVAGYAEVHAGRAWVEDRDEGGASFRVFLPGEA